MSLEPLPQLPPYRLQVGDIIDIKMMLNPELNEQVVIPPDGKISTTLAQDIMAYGRTVSDLQADLEDRYSGPDKLRDPQVAVILRSFAPTRVYVTGEVYTPGEFVTIGPNLTLMQAIARAGGVKNSANTDGIIILRNSPSGVMKGYSANYTDAASGNKPESNVRLAAYDVVYVPRSGIGNVYLHYQQYIQQFVPASVGANYMINPDDD